MTLVAHSDLPTFTHLREHGHTVLTVDRAVRQDIRELHIGLLNMMPDTALAATERQFIRLVGSCNQIAQFYVYPFSIGALARGPEASDHIDRYYSRFEDLQRNGLDALIITGANVANPDLRMEPFWGPLIDVVTWAVDNVASVLCSCLATHALVDHLYGIRRHRLPQKRWGVYEHQVSAHDHPLLRDINTRFDAPHSRYNEIRREDLLDAGLRILAESPEAGVHIAVSPDQFRRIYFQGHPEYDTVSLLKEYRREVFRFLEGELEEPPPYPENYFPLQAREIASEFVEAATHAIRRGSTIPEFSEDRLAILVDNTWGDTAKAIFNNWLGLVYRTTNLDRHQRYMPGVDPDDPLGLRR
ncbi:MAG: homoserine O-succinyltransferase [Gammaproteobacteria bacterium]|nr:homoserine O-succinyltransferase [Gammaproteobacteria bacterium]MDH5310462.1 homoserine O-succinyltransferase [Gammaproteobacteria bacterium]